jgi:flavin reductase (DIM6/NTAB) family NADH-FMN oxidoreductase RutF
MMFQAEDLREMMRSWTSGVALVTSHFEDRRHGMTVSSFTSVALAPPLVLVCIDTESRTHAMILNSKIFAAAILAEDQREIADRFAGRQGELEDQFESLPVITTPSGCPIPEGALAFVDCRVTAIHSGGASNVFMGQVTEAKILRQAPPLVYHDQHYRHLAE